MNRARAYARRYPRSYWVLLSGEGAQSLGFGLCVPYFALYATEVVGVSPAQAGLVILLWGLTALAGHPLGGVLADRFGRRPVMLAGLAGAGLSAVSFGLVGSLAEIAVVTVAWALFNSIFMPAAAAYVADVAPPALRTEAYGLWRVANNGFFALGPPLGALLVWTWSIRATFVCAGITILAYLVIVWWSLPESRPETSEEEPPARVREALRDRLLVVLALGLGASTFAYAFFEDALPVFLERERGISVVTWGLVFTINPVFVALLQYPIARWAARRSSRGVLAAGAVLQGGALMLLLPFEGVGGLVLAGLVLVVGEMLLLPVSSSLAAELAPARLRGSYQGVINLAWEGAWAPAALVGLWLVGRGQGEVMLALGLPLGVLAAVLFFALPGGALAKSAAVHEPVLAEGGPTRS